MIAWAVAVLVPTAGWLAGVWLVGRRPGRPSLPLMAGVGAFAPAGLQRWRDRSFLEQVAGWGLAFFGWTAALVGRDPEVLVATWLGGAAWGIVLGAMAFGEAATTGGGVVESPPPSLPAPAPRFSPPPAAAASHDDSDEGLAFRLTMRCPTCGAELGVPVHHHMTRCEFCASEHLVLGQGDVIRAVIPDAVTTRAAAHSAVLKYLRRLHFQKLYERRVRPLQEQYRVDAQGREAALLVDLATPAVVAAMERQVEAEADAYAARIAPRLEITEWQRFLAPYWHRLGTLYQVAFGRDAAGAKRLELAVVTLEASAAANPTPLPEMGRLSYLRALRPLAGSPEADLTALPVTLGREVLERTAVEPGRRTSELGIVPIAVRGTLVPETLALVYRPWHIVAACLDGDTHHLLVDGGGADVAGVPQTLLVEAEPLADAEGEPLHLTPSRCPECGHDLPFAVDTVAHLCRSCFRLLELSDSRWRVASYLREDPLPGTWLAPFWCFPLRLRTATGELVTDLAHLTDGVDGSFDQIGDRPQGAEWFFVPAFRTRVTKAGVRFYRRIWPLLRQRRSLSRERFSPASPPGEMVAVTLPAGEARVFARVYLALAFGPRDLARAEVKRVRAAFLDAELEGEPTLAFLNLPAEVAEPVRNLFGRTRPQAVRALGGQPRYP
ncbi:MAG: hypothetical protein AB2L07_22220 [Thermoanaerobaculaceae bacterium]